MTLKELRESKNIGPVAVARRLKITYAGVRRIEVTGETNLSTLEEYAEAIGAPFDAVHAASVETRRLAGKKVAGYTF